MKVIFEGTTDEFAELIWGDESECQKAEQEETAEESESPCSNVGKKFSGDEKVKIVQTLVRAIKSHKI